MDQLGGIGDVQQYLKGISYPAQKEEIATGAESNGAPQALVDQIRNSSVEEFSGPQDVMQAGQGS